MFGFIGSIISSIVAGNSIEAVNKNLQILNENLQTIREELLVGFYIFLFIMFIFFVEIIIISKSIKTKINNFKFEWIEIETQNINKINELNKKINQLEQEIEQLKNILNKKDNK